MSAIADEDFADAAGKQARREKLFARINKIDTYLKVLGLGWGTPILRAAAGDNPKAQGREVLRQLGAAGRDSGLPDALGASAPQVQTSLGAVPGPAQVWEQMLSLHEDATRKADKESAFYERQEERNEKLIAEGKEDRVKWREFTGAPSYYDQIWTSIQTVFFGFLLATVVAVPIGIICGLSPTASAAFNPLIQIFKPVSPLAGCRSSPWSSRRSM